MHATTDRDRIISSTVEKATSVMHTVLGFMERLTHLANPILGKLQGMHNYSGHGEGPRAHEDSEAFDFSIGDTDFE